MSLSSTYVQKKIKLTDFELLNFNTCINNIRLQPYKYYSLPYVYININIFHLKPNILFQCNFELLILVSTIFIYKSYKYYSYSLVCINISIFRLKPNVLCQGFHIILF